MKLFHEVRWYSRLCKRFCVRVFDTDAEAISFARFLIHSGVTDLRIKHVVES